MKTEGKIKASESQSNSVSYGPPILCTGYDPSSSPTAISHHFLCQSCAASIWLNATLFMRGTTSPFHLFFPPHTVRFLDSTTSQLLLSKKPPKLSNGKSISPLVKSRPHFLFSLTHSDGHTHTYTQIHTHTHTHTESHTVICPPSFPINAAAHMQTNN